MMLHARSITFSCPRRRTTVESPLPESFASVLLSVRPLSRATAPKRMFSARKHFHTLLFAFCKTPCTFYDDGPSPVVESEGERMRTFLLSVARKVRLKHKAVFYLKICFSFSASVSRLVSGTRCSQTEPGSLSLHAGRCAAGLHVCPVASRPGTSLLFLKNAALTFAKTVCDAATCILARNCRRYSYPRRIRRRARRQKPTHLSASKRREPGRVVWCTIPPCQLERPGRRPLVAGQSYAPGVVDLMFSRVLRELSGKHDEASAWDTLFRYHNRVHGRGAGGIRPVKRSRSKRILPSAIISRPFAVSTA